MPLRTKTAEKLQDFLTNTIDWEGTRDKKIVAILGETPSKYAKSPTVWNAGFEALGLNAVFLPFDLAEQHLKGLVEAIRREERFLGFSITVPYKIAIIPFLDELDPKAKAIGAVNTVVRTKEGRFVGYNTDGQGGIDSLLKIPASGSGPFLQTLKGMSVLLIGAGGAARSLAFYLGEAVAGGRLYLANRDAKKGEALCAELGRWNVKAEPLSEKEIAKVATHVNLIINATTKGQQGLRRLPDGSATCLEPYSALAPADPPSLHAKNEFSFFQEWACTAQADIQKNNARSFEILTEIPPKIFLFDIIYAPIETVFLRQGRWTGHPTLNGKLMNIAQAADAFYEKVVKSLLEEKGLSAPQTYPRLLQAMIARW